MVHHVSGYIERMSHTAYAVPGVLFERSQDSLLIIYANRPQSTNTLSSRQHRSRFLYTSNTLQNNIIIGMSFAFGKSFRVKMGGGTRVSSSYTVQHYRVGVVWSSIFRHLVSTLYTIISSARNLRHYVASIAKK